MGEGSAAGEEQHAEKRREALEWQSGKRVQQCATAAAGLRRQKEACRSTADGQNLNNSVDMSEFREADLSDMVVEKGRWPRGQ